MDKNILQFLACPVCKSQISASNIHDSKNSEIIAGSLFCSNCDLQYPIREGIPDFFGPIRNIISGGTSIIEEMKFRDHVMSWHPESDVNYIPRDTYYSAKKKALIKKHLGDLQGKWILDVGAGTGKNIDKVLTADSTFFLCDISWPTVKLLQKKYKIQKRYSNVHLFVAGATELPFANLVFDASLCLEVLQHIAPSENRTKCLSEISRCLKDRGHLLLMTLNFAKLRSLLRSLLLKPYLQEDTYEIKGGYRSPLYRYAYLEIASLLRNNNLLIDQCDYMHNFVQLGFDRLIKDHTKTFAHLLYNIDSWLENRCFGRTLSNSLFIKAHKGCQIRKRRYEKR